MRDIGIADRLRAAGLNVIEVDGWRLRGSDTFTPKGSVDHHTAGAASGNAPSLRICINGRSDLPGPLCNVLVGRDGTCYVVAAGRANHAGKGGWRGLTGNSTVYGVERENVGTPAEPWTDEQTETAARVHAALIQACSSPDPRLVCEHKEWAPDRKSDAHTIHGSHLSARAGHYLTNSGDDDMFDTPDRDKLNQIFEWALANQKLNEAFLLEKILAMLEEHVKNPATGGGAGGVDIAKLREDIANEIAERLAA